MKKIISAFFHKRLNKKNVGQMIVIFLMMRLAIFNLSGQVVDFSNATEGVLIPRMTEDQRKNMTTTTEGTLLYQSDGDKGFYFFDGSSWTKIGGSTQPKPEVRINGQDPSKFDLTYLGPSRAGSADAIAHQFVNSKGFYLDFLQNDSIAHASLLFTESSDCSGGEIYGWANISGRGNVANGTNDLIYIKRDAPIVEEINFTSALSFSLNGTSRCSVYNGTAEMVFEFHVNDPTMTGVTLDPKKGYRVSFGK